MCYNYYEKHDVSLVKLVWLFLADGSTADSVQERVCAADFLSREKRENDAQINYVDIISLLPNKK